MKRVYIAMTVVATAAIAGCQQEKSFEEDINLGENAITFTIPAGVSTKASDAVSYVRSGVSIPVNADDDGGALFLEETVEDLEVMSPATKGTPAYTGNVGKFYKTIGVYAEGLDNAQYELASEDLVNGGWLYHHNYSGDPWSTAGNEIDFYLRMPYDMAGVSNLAYGKTDEGSLKISFDYTSPSSETASAAAQEDLLFATTTLSKDQYNNYFKSASKGAPVLFRHALSGVKFATANHISGSESGTKTYITKVKFTGLKNSGSCTFIPKGEETTVDDKTEYTSAASMVWTPGETTGEFVQVFTTENYGENVYDGSDLLVNIKK